jgi:replicative DNA helicase
MIDSVSKPTLDRLPPHSNEAETGVLGCCLLDPNHCLGECIEKLKDCKESFYDLRHQTIYECLVEMFSDRAGIDLITVQQRLKDKNILEQIGGITYLSQLQDAVPSAANLSYYLDIVREKYLLRLTVRNCSEVVAKVYESEDSLDEVLDEVEAHLMKVSNLRQRGSESDTGTLVEKAIDMAERRFESKGQPQGLLTGLADFDVMTDGLHPAEMIVIAARPSMGKSSLAMNIAEHVFLESKLPVGVFSLEMSDVSLVERSIGSVGRVNVRRPWEWSENEYARYTNAASRIKAAKSRLHIDATAGLSTLELRAKARRMMQQHGIKLFVIDYLQLLHGTSRKAKDNRQVEVSEISSAIKGLAKELNVPIIVLSQLNRELEKNKRKPRMSDLRESGSIEQDADVIGLLSHDCDDRGNPITNDDGMTIAANLEIAKQRNGPTGDVKLTFFKCFTRFESAPKHRVED